MELKTETTNERLAVIAALLAAKRLGNGKKLKELLLQRDNDPFHLYKDICNGDIDKISISADKFEKARKNALEFLDDPLNFIITAVDEAYPAMFLRTSLSMPFVLFGRGAKGVFYENATAIVGTRRASLKKTEFAFQLARALAQQRSLVVSGGASGIDTASHRGALDAGGVTCVVFGTGHNHIYPSSNKELFEKICRSGGCTISELPPYMPGGRSTFGARNRLIAGLCRRVVMVEGGEKSGAMITAKEAFKLGRTVFAVPGDPDDDRAKGCNLLLVNGAKPCLGVETLLQSTGEQNHGAVKILKTNTKTQQKALFKSDKKSPENSETVEKDLSEEEKKVFFLLSSKPLHVDDISEKTGLNPANVSSVLTLLEIKGLAKKLSGMLYVNPLN